MKTSRDRLCVGIESKEPLRNRYKGRAQMLQRTRLAIVCDPDALD
jgi:hypothetical protein